MDEQSLDGLPDDEGDDVPVRRPGSYVAVQVARALRRAIASGELAPGTHIRQETIAERHGTSRVPVREALLALEREGLVNLVPHAGARVASLDPRELEEIYLLREQLEPFLIARSTTVLGDEALGELERRQQMMEKLVARSGERSEEIVNWLELDYDFHRLALSGADLPRFRRLTEEAWTTTRQYRRAFMLLPESFTLVHYEHRLLLDALQRRDAEDAARILTTHIRRVRLLLAPELADGSRRAAP